MIQFTDEQNAFLAANGNVILHACPGSGKTTVVAKKLLQYIDCWNRAHKGVAVLSFTNVASQEIESQVNELLSTSFPIGYPHFVGTLDSFINNFVLLRFGYLLFEDHKRPIIATKDNYSLPFAFWRSECYKNNCVDRIESFRWDKEGHLFRNNEPVTCVGRGAYKPPCYQYKKMLLKKGYIFQGDAPSLAYWLLKSFPSIASALASRFPIIILDEAQDASAEQMAIIDAINHAGTESVFLVGDPDQAIYEWRNATPECFIEKMMDPRWHLLHLSVNFRSSQKICNATKLFAASLVDKSPSTAIGPNASFATKPTVYFYDGDIANSKPLIIEKFREQCISNGIGIDSSRIAIVTRSKVHTDTDISGLWKSHEVEFLAQSAYEWSIGSRKKAYELCESFLYGLVVDEYRNVTTTFRDSIEDKMRYDIWHTIVISLLVQLPSCNLPIGQWISLAQEKVSTVCAEYALSPIKERSISDVVKIKSRDHSVPQFKEIPLKNFFEVKQKVEFTVSSIHGVKGESYDAIMLIIENKTGQTITPKFLNEATLNQELMRIAYVAMTRPRKLLVVAMPRIASRKEYPRFPKELWDYVNV